MSASVVGHAHIDALLTWAINHRVDYWNGSAHVTITAENAETIGQELLDVNTWSVQQRYGGAEDDLPGFEGETAAGYRFRLWWRDLSPVAIIRSWHCWDYQSCEFDGWQATLAHTIIRAIESNATSSLPGYGEAEGWPFERQAADAPRLAL